MRSTCTCAAMDPTRSTALREASNPGLPDAAHAREETHAVMKSARMRHGYGLSLSLSITRGQKCFVNSFKASSYHQASSWKNPTPICKNSPNKAKGSCII